jgi:hypothetical protein
VNEKWGNSKLFKKTKFKNHLEEQNNNTNFEKDKSRRRLQI